MIAEITPVSEATSRYVDMPSAKRGERVFGLSRTTLYRLAGVGKIRVINVGRKALVDAKSVSDYLDNLPSAPISVDSRMRAA